MATKFDKFKRRKPREKPRKEKKRNRASDKTLIYNGWLSDNVFLLNAYLAASHIL